MSKPTVLLIGGLTHCMKEWKDLGSKYNLKEYITGSREDFLLKCESGEFDDVVGLYRSNNSVSETGPFDKELVAVLPESLKWVAHNGAGYDNIDVDACTKRGIYISSTPIAVDDATADVGIFLMLGALRHAMIPLTAIRDGKWRGKTPIGHDPKGKVLGILGMGGIGRVSVSDNMVMISDQLAGNGSTCSRIRHEDRIPQPIETAGRAGRRCNIPLVR
jgi:glyoxylate reductase